MNKPPEKRGDGKQMVFATGVEHRAELIAYKILLLTLAILPLAFALSSPTKDPFFIAMASLVSSFFFIGLGFFTVCIVLGIRRD